jgi:hypothetical protein
MIISASRGFAATTVLLAVACFYLMYLHEAPSLARTCPPTRSAPPPTAAPGPPDTNCSNAAAPPFSETNSVVRTNASSAGPYQCYIHDQLSYCVYQRSLCLDQMGTAVVLVQNVSLAGKAATLRNSLQPSPWHLPFLTPLRSESLRESVFDNQVGPSRSLASKQTA